MEPKGRAFSAQDARPSGLQSSCLASFSTNTGIASYAVPARRLPPPTGFPRKNGRAPARSATAGSKIPPTTLLAILGRIPEIHTSLGEKTDASPAILISGFVTCAPRAARISTAGSRAAAVRLAIEPPAARDQQAANAPTPIRISSQPP